MPEETLSIERPLWVHIQRNWRTIEILCVQCYFIGELEATRVDIRSPEMWRDAAECFTAQGWNSLAGQPLCPECCSKQLAHGNSLVAS